MKNLSTNTSPKFVALLACAVSVVASASASMLAGSAGIDITPRSPVQLINVKTPAESQGVGQRLFARALALGEGTNAVVLISFDGIGVPATLADKVATRILAARGLSRPQVSICATHTHWAPHLSDLLGTIYGGPLPSERQRRVDAYTDWLADRLEAVALEALDRRESSQVAWATGRVTFAANRRMEPGGQLLRDEEKGLMVTWNPDGPVDHDLPVLTVHATGSGELTAVHFTYACHNVALTGSTAIGGFTNSIHGDWAGLAQEEIERRHPGCIAVCTIGCGGDQRPNFCGGIAVATTHARELADEVDRLLARTKDWQPVSGPVTCGIDHTRLPLAPIQSAAELQKFADNKRSSASVAARAFLAKLRLRDLGRVPTAVPFVSQSWRFAQGPDMVFLSGEVCIDYQIRIKREHGSKVWPIAYANATPGYIVSRRMLKAGGYEAGNSQFYYGWLRPLKPEVEELVMKSVAAVIGAAPAKQANPQKENR
jgi:hypothetical protein